MIDFISSPVLALTAGLFYLVSTVFVFRVAYKRSRFSFILIFSELFYIVGIGFGAVYLGLGLGFAESDRFYMHYIAANGPISDLTFYHIILYSIGMSLGMVFYDPSRAKKILTVADNSKSIIAAYGEQISLYRKLIFIGFLFLGIYIVIVGPEVALTTGAKSRAGIMEGLEDSTAFLFLKNIAQIGVFSVIFIPVVLKNRKLMLDLSALAIFGISLYLITGARAAILDTIYFAILIYLARTKLDLKSTLMLVFFISAGVFFALYGKGFNDELFSYILGKELSVTSIQKDINIQSFMTQFIGLIFSVDAGIKYFMDNGPTLSKAILLSPLGILPSWLFTDLGLDSLNWKNVSYNDDIVCLNTAAYPLASGCTIPPYYTGTSAYLFPLLFGFLFGILRFFIYSAISCRWHMLKLHPHLLWKSLLAYILFVRISLFIPNVIGLLSFLAIFSFIIFYLPKIIRRMII